MTLPTGPTEPSGPQIIEVEVSADGPARPPQTTGARTWSVSREGLATVAGLELRQRVRSRKWIGVLVLWFCLIGCLTMLVRWTASQQVDDEAMGDQFGRVTFAVIVFMVLSLGGLVSPALSATSVNGDRTAGVLAVLQTTLLSPAEIVLGKLLAAWSIALTLLAVASPFILWALVDGGTSGARVATTLVLLALTLLVVCAIGLGWSAITVRTATSAVLTYLTVAALAVGLPLLFALTLQAVRTEDEVRVHDYAPTAAVDPGAELNGTVDQDQCAWRTEKLDRYHTERSWWLLAASPYVVVADAAPMPGDDEAGDPLSAIRTGVRQARLGPADAEDWCGNSLDDERRRQGDALPATWPWGLALDLGLGAAFVVVAIRRLRAPMRKLPSGARVA